jgi:LysW-gamma-L-lysine carboxypeptidase
LQVDEILLTLLKTYTPSGEERRLEPDMKRLQKELGYDELIIDKTGNYLLIRGSGEKTILLASHVDTVPGELAVSQRSGVIIGRGAVDAKGPLAAMIYAGAKAPIGPDYRVVVAGLVDEEGAGTGALGLLESGFAADHIIIGEPTGVIGIAISYRGSLTFTLTASGRGGHSSAPYVGDSALDKLLSAINEIKAVFSGSSYEETTSAVTMIRAGDWPTKLPERAEATINIRFPPGIDASSILEKVEVIASLHECKLSIIDSTEPFNTSLSSPVPRALIRSIIKHGLKPKILKKTGTSDMNILFKMSSDIAACGPGNSLLAHTPNEKISVEELSLSSSIYIKAIEELSKRASHS